MLKKDCKYYPCHNNLEDCDFCFCPIYPCEYEKLGVWVKSGNYKVWDCSNCEMFHKKNVAEKYKNDSNK